MIVIVQYVLFLKQHPFPLLSGPNRVRGFPSFIVDFYPKWITGGVGGENLCPDRQKPLSFYKTALQCSTVRRGRCRLNCIMTIYDIVIGFLLPVSKNIVFGFKNKGFVIRRFG